MKDKTYQRRREKSIELDKEEKKTDVLSHIHLNNKAITAPSINSPREEEEKTNEIILIYIRLN